MDEVYEYNRERWEALVEAGALFTRPWLDLDECTARERLDLAGVAGDLEGKEVLCLAGGGGQQSAAFSVLGARVTVLDIAEGQLDRDREVARRYGRDITTVQGDMRDLSAFGDDAFDLVWHPYSLNFVPSALEVFRQVARVIRDAGVYHFMSANPFAPGIGTVDWNGDGYSIRHRYQDGAVHTYDDEEWVFGQDGAGQEIQRPREFRQTLSSLLNGLLSCGFLLLKTEEFGLRGRDSSAEPGTWGHLLTVIPPWIKFWAAYRPEVVCRGDAT